MSTTGIYVIVVILGLGILFFALKFGTIGGAGAGARRDENPLLYWLGVSITGGMVLLGVIMLVFVRPT